MGDTYSAGQAGAIGPGATASQLTFQQVWAQLQGSTSVEELAKQLGALRMAMRSAASEPEHELSIGAVAAAEAAAKAGDCKRDRTPILSGFLFPNLDDGMPTLRPRAVVAVLAMLPSV